MSATSREEAGQKDDGVLIRVRGVRKRLGGQQVLNGVDLDIRRRETLVLLGRSGGGKSVLLKLLIGLIRPDGGVIEFDGINLGELDERSLAPVRRRFGMLFQGAALFDSLDVAANIAFPLREAGERDPEVIREKVREALAVVGLEGQEHKMPVNLSGGMRKRVGLARAIVTRPECILYDEPTAGLDPISTDGIDRLIKDLQQRFNATSVVITHDLGSAWKIADRVAFLHQGRIAQIGTPQELCASGDPLIRDFTQGRCADRSLV